MKILVTGSAGFIGSHVVIRLLDQGNLVVGLDNHNNYYDQSLKEARLSNFVEHPNYRHLRMDLVDRNGIDDLFKHHRPNRVVHLAAQAGVRYSIDNPMAYIESNIVGFANILEGCKNHKIDHLVYASSSSVYGANTIMPFSVHHNTDHPLSLYAASKKSNELMAYTYSKLYHLHTTGLRLFTVYGPWGRPDMALFKFTKSILAGERIQVFNHGQHKRDFTYIDDIVEAIIRVLNSEAKTDLNWNSDQLDPSASSVPWSIHNVGSGKPIQLMEYIEKLEHVIGKKALIDFLPMQPGDAPSTFADVTDLVKKFDFNPTTSVEMGISNFISWYLDYFK